MDEWVYKNYDRELNRKATVSINKRKKTKHMSFQKYGMLRANKFKELGEGPIKPLHQAVRKDMLC